MTMERHAEIADRLEAYVLDQLTEVERREVEEHFGECSTCMRELYELHMVLEGVVASVPPVTPPATLRERVLAAVATEQQEPVRRERRVGIVQQPRRPFPAIVPWAAAAVVVLAVGVVAFRLIDQSRRELADQVSRVQALNTELGQRLRLFRDQTDLALSILTARDMREISLDGRENAVAAEARAFLSPTRGLLLVADRIPEPPPGRVYQVWIIEGNQPVSAGLLGEEPGGRGMLIATPPRPGGGGSVTVAITDEPPGGLPAPSGAIRLAGSI
jgi:anti-sigma-K factor RskA